MLSKVTRHFATFLSIAVGVLGVLGVLYAWGLPPFETGTKVTEDAYVRGEVTFLAPQVAGEVSEIAVDDFEKVSKGDLLLRLDGSTYRQQLAQAEARLEAARAMPPHVRRGNAQPFGERRRLPWRLVGARARLGSVLRVELGLG